ncbi:hypothetical protein TNCV_1163131 [Trichonephila clavipes]|nr:hypothetical protein TNCV_1163131 [Trichonephila clavipes]
MVWNHTRHTMSSSPVPLKTRRVGQRCTSDLSRAETSVRWCGVAESAPEPNEIGNDIEEVQLARQINLEMYSDHVQEVLNFHNQKLTNHQLIKMHEQDI